MEAAVRAVEDLTGQVYGELWHHYDDAEFKHSVSLFERRWLANGEPADFFLGKRVLDVGCGGGRYSIAMALMGAASVTGVDVSDIGLADARRRVDQLGMSQISLRKASVLELPFADGEFDFVLCSGILQHTPGIERGLAELYRVVRPGGSVFILVYGTGGLIWPWNYAVRPCAQLLGPAEVDRGVELAGFSASKRRTIMDALFCPILETYTTERVDFLLRETGFQRWRRWTTARLDHEEDAESLLGEIATFARLFAVGAATADDPAVGRIWKTMAETSSSLVAMAREIISQQQAGRLTEAQLREAVVGIGHHRLIAERPR